MAIWDEAVEAGIKLSKMGARAGATSPLPSLEDITKLAPKAVQPTPKAAPTPAPKPVVNEPPAFVGEPDDLFTLNELPVPSFPQARARQTELLTTKSGGVGGNPVPAEKTPEFQNAYKSVFGGDPDDNDIALMHAFGTGYREGSSSYQSVDLKNMLKVSASLLEVAPELSKLDTVMKFSNGAPMLMWRGASLRDLISDPMDMFRRRISDPTEVGAHAGTYDQAQTFSSAFGSIIDDLKKGNSYEVSDGIESFVSSALSDVARLERTAMHKVTKDVERFIRDFIDTEVPKDEADLLMKAGDKGVVVDDTAKRFYEAHKDDILESVRSAYSEVKNPNIKMDSLLEEVESYFEAKFSKGLKGVDKVRGVEERTGQLVPFVPVYKNPVVFRDVGSNDASSIISAIEQFPGKYVADQEEFKPVLEAYHKYVMKGTDENKALQDALADNGFDAIQYINTAEGVGQKMSLVLFNEKNIKPLHELVPSLGKLKEALRKRVYNMMAVGVPLPLALQLVQMEQEDDGAA